MKVLKALFLISLISFSSAYQQRSVEDIKRRDDMLRHVDAFAELFQHEYLNFTRTGLRSERLDAMMQMIKLPTDFARVEPEELPPEEAIMSCIACRSSIGLILQQYRSGQRTKEETIEDSIALCMQLTTYGIEVCTGVVRINADSFVYIIDQRPSLTAQQICSLVLQGECGDPDQVFNFSINISPGPPITESKSGSTPRHPNELRILHLSDPHYDPNYLVDGFANCPEPVCCRRNRGIAPNPEDRAGRWGDLRNCDSPWEVVEDAVRAARANHPIVDAIYITGDYIDHGIWETTHQGNIQIWDRFYGLVRQVFPGIPIYPVLGNHEANPTNIFAPPHITDPTISTHWLYEYHANNWMQFLPPSTQATIRRGGYYTVLHSPGFRIIALNNNDCYRYNWWVMYSRDELIHQLNWFHNTLLAAEAAGERVHVLTHIFPGGGSCFRWWSQNYRRVIERFHRIISGQFYGHSHRDEFNVFYANDNINLAINYAWNGGATTTYSNLNPNYVLYYVDRTLFQVNEKESWMYSATEANLNPATPPRWFRVSSFRDEFGIPDLSPASLDHWIMNTLSRNRATLRRYFEIRHSLAEPHVNRVCDDSCLRGNLCSIVRNEFGDNRKCDQVSQHPLQ